MLKSKCLKYYKKTNVLLIKWRWLLSSLDLRPYVKVRDKYKIGFCLKICNFKDVDQLLLLHCNQSIHICVRN